jgi:hypothetical protein
MAVSEIAGLPAVEVEPLGLPGQSEFDALHAHKYAHGYDQSAIAN